MTKIELPLEKKKKLGAFHEYFEAHECHLPAEKITAFELKCSRFRKVILDLTTVRPGDIRARNMFKSYAALRSEKYRQCLHYPMSIHPFSKIRIWCEAFFVVGMVIANTVLAIHYSEMSPNRMDYHDAIMHAFDCMYLLNIIINFFTGYIEGNTRQYVVLDLRKICCRYARTWLASDLFAAFSFLTTYIMDPNNVVPQLCLLSLKLLRMPILMAYLDNVMTVLKLGIIKRTLVEIVVVIFSYITWNIFFQYAVEYMYEGDYQPENPRICSWITMANLWNQTTHVRFIYALDRAVGMLRKNTNINLLARVGCFEIFFVISWLIAKLLVYHCALKYIVALLGSESAKSKYYSMTKQVEAYMNQRMFPPRIKQKIMKFYAIRYQSNYFAESKMLECVTGQLREDIIMHTGRQLVRELAFLKQLPRSLLLQIGLKLRVVIFIAGDIIFKINTAGDCIYFIDKGTVAIYSQTGNEICHLEDGDYFGEIALVMKHSFRTTSAVAVSNCELFRLDKDEFDNSIACYPTVYETIKKVAVSRFERTYVLDEHHKTELNMWQSGKDDLTTESSNSK